VRDGAPLHPDCRAAVDDAAHLLESLGHRVEESHPDALDENKLMWRHFTDIVACHAVMTIQQQEEIERSTRTRKTSKSGRVPSLSAASVFRPRATCRQFNWCTARRVASWWSAQGFDLLLTPTIASPPLPARHTDGDARGSTSGNRALDGASSSFSRSD
jgi:amidase